MRRDDVKAGVLGVAAGLWLAGVAGAGAQVTGVSHPDETPVEATQEQPAVLAPAKPSAAVQVENGSVAAGADGAGTYGRYVPYTGGATSATLTPRPMTEEEADGAVVMHVADPAGALREGTQMQARIRERLSTLTTEEGARFSAELVAPVEKEGRVVLPVGSVIRGRVTSVHGGKRISGKAAIHLEADTIQVPGGARYDARLQVIDTDQPHDTKVDSEGSLVKRDHAKETVAVLGVTTGAGAVTGAVAGGPVGAAVGAGIGASVGTVLWLKQDRQETLPEHALLVFELEREMPLEARGERPEVASSHTIKPVADPDASVVGVPQ